MKFKYTKKLLEIGAIALIIGFVSSVLTNGKTIHALNFRAVGDLGCQFKYVLITAIIIVFIGILVDFVISIFGKSKGKSQQPTLARNQQIKAGETL